MSTSFWKSILYIYFEHRNLGLSTSLIRFLLDLIWRYSLYIHCNGLLNIKVKTLVTFSWNFSSIFIRVCIGRLTEAVNGGVLRNMCSYLPASTILKIVYDLYSRYFLRTPILASYRNFISLNTIFFFFFFSIQ